MSSQGWLKSIHESAFRFQSITSIHDGDTQVRCIASVAAAENIEAKKRVDGEEGDDREAAVVAQGTLEKQRDGEKEEEKAGPALL